MVEAKLISLDGTTELNVMQNFMGQGRPGFMVRYMEESGQVVHVDFPLEPSALGGILKILLDGQSAMLNSLVNEMRKAMVEAEEELQAERQDASVIKFKNRDF